MTDPVLSDDTLITIPVRNLIALAAALVIATTAYVTINTRITTTEHNIEMQGAQIDMNSNFRVTWPKEGLLAADVQQNSRLDSIEVLAKEQSQDVRQIQADINELKIVLGIAERQSEIDQAKIQELFDLWNSRLAKE